jgi:hypothetical protein
LKGAAKGIPRKLTQSKDSESVYITGPEIWRQLLAGKQVEVSYESLGSLLCSLKTSDIVKSENRKRKSTDLRNGANYEHTEKNQKFGPIHPRRIA